MDLTNLRLRRCFSLVIEPADETSYSFAELARSGDGMLVRTRWLARAGHLDAPVELQDDELLALKSVPAERWSDFGEIAHRIGEAIATRLVRAGLLVVEATEAMPAPMVAAAGADATLRGIGWHRLAAVMHRHSQWAAVDAGACLAQAADVGYGQLLDAFGPPPAVTPQRASVRPPIALPAAVSASPLDDLLSARTTCRNFDPHRPLPLPTAAVVLQRVFGAQAQAEPAPGHHVLKKTSPSAGALHPTEAYLLAQNVGDVPAGIYHYHPLAHQLRCVAAIDASAVHDLVTTGLAGQRHFDSASAIVVLTARFERTFWKYREHSKAYRAMLLDVGHLSQTLYLSASELGLGAFVTCAINEAVLEQALCVDPVREGVVAVCGFGARASERTIVEFDPASDDFARQLPRIAVEPPAA